MSKTISSVVINSNLSVQNFIFYVYFMQLLRRTLDNCD